MIQQKKRKYNVKNAGQREFQEYIMNTGKHDKAVIDNDKKADD